MSVYSTLIGLTNDGIEIDQRKIAEEILTDTILDKYFKTSIVIYTGEPKMYVVTRRGV